MKLTICPMHVRIQWAVWWGILLSAGSQAPQHNLLLGWSCGVVCTTSESRGARAWDLMRTFAVSLSSESQTPWLRGSFIPYLSFPHALPRLALSWGPERSLIRVKCIAGVALPSTRIVENMFRWEQLEKGCYVQPPGSASSNVFQNFCWNYFIILLFYL